ncbi:MAG TPA: M50 family metallopeptidase [Longimicrobiales bacterium]|nr:M50 family metallopeptidase [Longimicrobiales bacterium]
MKSRLPDVLPVALLALAGAIVGYLAASGGLDPLPGVDLTRGQTLTILASLPLVYVLCIAVHEAGHVLGGRLVDFRTLLFIVGPLRIERTADGFEAGLNRSVALAGGLAAMVPAGLHDIRRRTVVMVASGPTASLMVGAQFLVLYQVAAPALARPGAGFPAHFTAMVLAATGILSLLVGIITLIPGRSGGFYSDGARLLRLMRADDAAEREIAIISITGMSMAGTRPRDWDRRLVDHGAGIRDGGPFEVGGLQLAFAHALDSGDIDAARRNLEAALQRMGQLPGSARSSLLLAAATFFALYDGDADRARDLLRHARDGVLAAPHRRRLAEAAVRLADGDIIGARAAAREVPLLARRAVDRGGAAMDEALAARILSGD